MIGSDTTSLTLLERAIARQPDAWEKIVILYSPLIRWWCRQAGVSGHDVEDVAQNILAAVVSNIASYDPHRPDASFRGWLRGVARNKLRQNWETKREAGLGGTDALNRLEQVPDTAGDFELCDEPSEIAAVTHRAMEMVRVQFEELTWQAFWRVVVGGRMPAEVALELSISPNAVRQAKSRVLRRLRDEMGNLLD